MSDTNPKDDNSISEDELLEMAISSTDRSFNIEIPVEHMLSSENSSVSGGNVADISDFALTPAEEEMPMNRNDSQQSVGKANQLIDEILAFQAQEIEMRALAKVTSHRRGRSRTQLLAIPSTSGLSVKQPESEPEDKPKELSIPKVVLKKCLKLEDIEESMLSLFQLVTFVLPDNTTLPLYLRRTANYDDIVKGLRLHLQSSYNTEEIIFELRCVSPRMNLGKKRKNWTLADFDFPTTIVIQVIFLNEY